MTLITITSMSHLREGIRLRGYGKESPLQAYTMEGYDLFYAIMVKIKREVSMFLMKAEIRHNLER